MKVFAAILCFLVAVQATPARNTCELQSDMQQIIALVDSDAIAEVLYNHLEDPDMQNVFAFLFSQQFRDLYLTASSQDEVQRMGLWLEEQCVDVRSYLNRLRDYLGLPHVPWNSVPKARNGVANFWEDLLAAVPLAEMHEMAETFYARGGAFTEFVDNMRGPEAQDLFLQLADNETWRHMITELEANGINISAIREILGAILGWS